MTINESTVADAVNRGDSITIWAIVSTLIHKLNARETERKLQVGTTNKLRKAFMETETDRDRLRRMVESLVQLCEERGLSEEALKVLESYGGINGAKDDSKEIAIELD